MPRMMDTSMENTRHSTRLLPPRVRMKLENLSPRPVRDSMAITIPEAAQAATI